MCNWKFRLCYNVFARGECKRRYQGSLYSACRGAVMALAKARGPVVEVRIQDPRAWGARRRSDLTTSRPSRRRPGIGAFRHYQNLFSTFNTLSQPAPVSMCV
eukprot:scaffold94884_cov17-Prasinocladus_malaysianus.AAC.1